MKTYRVNEIFKSIQGEGPLVGKHCVFVRFAGCNLSCTFCDTDHEAYNEMTLDQITNDILDAFGSTWRMRMEIVLTGGEPLLQVDEELIERMSDIGWPRIETNGSKEIEVHRSISDLEAIIDKSYVVVSPKGGPLSAGLLAGADCLKVLVPYPADFGPDELRWCMEHVDEEFCELVLQPVTPGTVPKDMKTFRVNCRTAVALADELARDMEEQWRVIPQVHRLMGVR